MDNQYLFWLEMKLNGWHPSKECHPLISILLHSSLFRACPDYFGRAEVVAYGVTSTHLPATPPLIVWSYMASQYTPGQ